MTVEQKRKIEELRRQGLGYCTVAKQVGLPSNTVKTYCRRNNLSTFALSGKAPSTEAKPIVKHPLPAEPAQTTQKVVIVTPKEKAPPECEVTLSYRANPDMRAVTDVMMTLMNISMR